MRCAALCLLLGCACFAATTHAAPQRGFPTFCGRELIDLKTLTDPRRKLVDFRPRATTVGAINARPMPRPTPRVRTAGFERQLWEVVAEITEYRLLPNGDL